MTEEKMTAEEITPCSVDFDLVPVPRRIAVSETAEGRSHQVFHQTRFDQAGYFDDGKSGRISGFLN